MFLIILFKWLFKIGDIVFKLLRKGFYLFKVLFNFFNLVLI